MTAGKPKPRGKSASERLAEIAMILEMVDARCLAVDGPVSKTREEITDSELRRIYKLAKADHHKAADRAAARVKARPR